MSPDPKPNHQEVAFRLLLALNELLKGSNFVARERTNIELSGLTSMPSPDVFVIDRKRWNQALRSSNYPQGAPQLVIEIVSPSNRKQRVLQKVKLYLAAGSAEVWVIYPKRKIAHVHRAGEESIEESALLRLPQPLSGGVILLDSLFAVDAEM